MKIKDQYIEYLKLKEIWYAPAGLQRGTISDMETYLKLEI